MKLSKEDVLEILRGIVAIAIIVGFIVFMILGVKQCEVDRQKYMDNLPPYKAYYGDFWGSESVYFYSYTVEGGRYLFYDEDGSFIKEFMVTDGIKIAIESKR